MNEYKINIIYNPNGLNINDIIVSAIVKDLKNNCTLNKNKILSNYNYFLTREEVKKNEYRK
ncbi:MAG: hypothetical protein RSB77_03955 [Bacilli bacterium]